MIINVKSNYEDGVERMEILSFMIVEKLSLEVTVILGRATFLFISKISISRATPFFLSRVTLLSRATTFF